MNYEHHNAIAIHEPSNTLFSADSEGFLYSFTLDTLAQKSKTRISQGTVLSLVINGDLIAAYSRDQRLVVGTIRDGNFSSLDEICLYNLRTDDYQAMNSPSQCLAVNPNNEEIFARAANGAAVYLKLVDGQLLFDGYLRVFEDADIVNARYVQNGKRVLVGSVAGDIALIENRKVVKRWALDEIKESVHWFEELDENKVVAATDSRRLVKIDLSSFDVQIGPVFAQDDLEYVGVLRDGDLFASSFDRNVYRLDTDSLCLKGIIHCAPFKLRWVESLSDSDDIIVQVRNGSIRRVNSETGELLFEHKRTCHAIWSVALDCGETYFAGEGPNIYKKTKDGGVEPVCEIKSSDPNSYTKRIAAKDGILLIGRTDGVLSIFKENQLYWQVCPESPSAIRDLALHPHLNLVYVAREDGSVTVYDYYEKEIKSVQSFGEPVWSLAISPSAQYLSVSQRVGMTYILDATTFEEVSSCPSRLPKRSKWADDNTLFVGNSDVIHKVVLDQDWSLYEEFYLGAENTIEDFAWDEERRYLFAVSYNRKVFLFDYHSGDKLDQASDGTEAIKGLLVEQKWGAPHATTFGRSGKLITYSVANRQLFPVEVRSPW